MLQGKWNLHKHAKISHHFCLACLNNPVGPFLRPHLQVGKKKLLHVLLLCGNPLIQTLLKLPFPMRVSARVYGPAVSSQDLLTPSVAVSQLLPAAIPAEPASRDFPQGSGAVFRAFMEPMRAKHFSCNVQKTQVK